MHIKFLFLTNAVLTFASNIPWANVHRSYEEDRQLSSSSKQDAKLIKRRNNEQLRPEKMKENTSIIDKHTKTKEEEEDMDPWNLSKDTDRIQFQIEGHNGPKTYIFGFDTGYGKNRQYRLEERHRDGTIKGQYGYYDATGKLRRVRYVAKPFGGYTEVHHESNVQKIEN